jgi:hypothetical protein
VSLRDTLDCLRPLPVGIPRRSMTVAELSDAIPPAYSQYIAQQWLAGRNEFAARKDGEASDAASVQTVK